MATKARRASARDDLVSTILSGCETVGEFIAATRGVIDEAEVRERHARAANTGQFRMAIANRMRGEIEKARRRLLEERRSGRWS